MAAKKRRARRRKDAKPSPYKRKRVVKVERISRKETRLILSCGHTFVIADQPSGKRRPTPTHKKCFKCAAKVPPDRPELVKLDIDDA
jgi:hypothetical protein